MVSRIRYRLPRGAQRWIVHHGVRFSLERLYGRRTRVTVRAVVFLGTVLRGENHRQLQSIRRERLETHSGSALLWHRLADDVPGHGEFDDRHRLSRRLLLRIPKRQYLRPAVGFILSNAVVPLPHIAVAPVLV